MLFRSIVQVSGCGPTSPRGIGLRMQSSALLWWMYVSMVPYSNLVMSCGGRNSQTHSRALSHCIPLAPLELSQNACHARTNSNQLPVEAVPLCVPWLVLGTYKDGSRTTTPKATKGLGSRCWNGLQCSGYVLTGISPHQLCWGDREEVGKGRD